MMDALWTDIALGAALGLLASVMFYVLASRTDVFGFILATTAFFCFEVFVMTNYDIAAAIFFLAIAVPGMICGVLSDDVADILEETSVAAAKIIKPVKLLFYKLIGKKVKEVRNE